MSAVLVEDEEAECYDVDTDGLATSGTGTDVEAGPLPVSAQETPPALLSDDFVDVEPGQVLVAPPNRDLVRVISLFFVGIIVMAYMTEYWQEYQTIAHLKLVSPLSDRCASSTHTDEHLNWVYRMMYHTSGLDEVDKRECEHQHEVHALLSIPNPFSVLVNVFWRAFMGHTSLSRLFYMQSWVLQIILVLAATIVVCVLVYLLITHLPQCVGAALQRPDLYRKQVYDFKQRQLRHQHVQMRASSQPSIPAVGPAFVCSADPPMVQMRAMADFCRTVPKPLSYLNDTILLHKKDS